MIRFRAYLFIILFSFGYSLGAVVPATPAMESKPKTMKKAFEKAQDMTGSHTMTEIVFDKDSIILSQSARAQLRDFLADAQKRGKIVEVKIASWADKEYPVGDKNLDKDARRLADDRIYEIRNYVEDGFPGAKVSAFNMAEKPDALEEYFGSSPNTKIKKALDEAGLAHPHKSGMPAKSSHALVLVTLE